MIEAISATPDRRNHPNFGDVIWGPMKMNAAFQSAAKPAAIVLWAQMNLATTATNMDPR